MDMPQCLVNGQATDLVSSSDRGLLYGDGLFETMAVVTGKIPLWQLHIDRLQRGCEILKLACPPAEVLHAEVDQLAKDAERAIIKLMLTRGVGGRGYAPPASAVTTRIIQYHPWQEVLRDNWETGVRVIFCEQQLARQPVLAGIKHLNRLEQVLARAEWQDPTIQEGLLADCEGNIIEAVSHNVFTLNGKTLTTPDLRYSGVAGVMREYLFTLARERGYSVQITTVSKQDLLAADAVFLCNSIHGIWPICELDGKHYPLNQLVCDLRDTIAQVIPYL
jgi:4-amino-4-deoxychorismate lyase